ncbi:MAG: FecR domain-containing protein [Candidatus Hydrogenedentes bacterium]|nr:FecR domain-containing protein [Candidatus Hydrogenedentota bacterium]
MVSCTRIESTLQAYIDGELGDSDRVIFEQHLEDCGVCRDSLKKQQRTNAILFTVFSEDRLSHSLRSRILTHLPLMEVTPRDSDSVVDLINQRAKNPRTLWGIVGRLMPVAAAAILVFVALILNYSYNSTDANELATATSVGMVTQARGSTDHAPGNGPEVQPAELQNYVLRGDRFDTRSGSSIMIALTGPTALKIGDSSRVLIKDAREITLEFGQIWLDVSRDGSKLFKVHTPRGDVTVFGTCFAVSHLNDETTVTVERGEVQVEKGNDFRALERGEQVRVLASGSLTEPSLVDAKSVNAWARRIMPDPLSENAFAKRLQVKAPSGELPARLVYMVNTYGKEVTALRLYWQPQPGLNVTSYCAYDLYVSSEASGAPIMHKKIEGNQFKDAEGFSLDVPMDSPVTDATSLEIRLVPNYSSGGSELSDVDIKCVVPDKKTVEPS